ncbi:MAG: ABC transporter ATP-binding protein [Calothrix sp. MO_167.B12]|nr:ABC transporter ATP-binding protein [Calothrix sp. MO_167.B12]
MSDTVIRVENLGKKYIIGHQQQERYTSLRDVIANGAKGFLKPFQNGKSKIQNSSEEFWALKDVSFEIKQGDRVGIIGRNGAGKSTLLKILSRITEPTQGRINIKGRVASLLEVGTGFHPELTGRENIFLNGAILGMSKAEIKRKFDEIVAFAEVEKFLDTPVKRYSSGMYVRLAFAVAAHLEPEILIVDEVLAVGDAAFQKKCLGKMKDVATEGRTVLFVSHNMAAINSLCSKSFLFHKGSIIESGETSAVTEKYFSYSSSESNLDYGESWYKINQKAFHKHSERSGFKFTNIGIINPKSLNKVTQTGDPLLIRLEYSTNIKYLSPGFVIQIKDIYGQELIRLSTMPISGYIIETLHSNGLVELLIKEVPLASGRYVLDIGFVRERIEWIVKLENILEFDIAPQDVYGSGIAIDRSRGLLVVKHEWNYKEKYV